MKKIHEKISEICTTLKLRNEFKMETELHWINAQNEPEIDYVYWLEAKVLNSNLEKLKTTFKNEMRGKMRRWLQNNAINGSTVTWGSTETLHFQKDLTAKDFEELFI